jgi:hypothetical protein
VAILAAMPLLWIAPRLNAQSTSPSTQQSASFQESDITRQELARFDRFLDDHHDIAQRLRSDPSLVNDQDYLEDHPDLQTYLQQHPGIREEIKEHPNYFMQQENRYDRQEAARGDIDTNRRQELAQFDRFLDGHREVSEQLRRDPSLVNNREYLEFAKRSKKTPTLSCVRKIAMIAAKARATRITAAKSWLGSISFSTAIARSPSSFAATRHS